MTQEEEMGTDVQKLTVIIQDATGFAGDGVLRECLDHLPLRSVAELSRMTSKPEANFSIADNPPNPDLDLEQCFANT
jgi:hypothetical protein